MNCSNNYKQKSYKNEEFSLCVLCRLLRFTKIMTEVFSNVLSKEFRANDQGQGAYFLLFKMIRSLPLSLSMMPLT